MIKDKRPPEEIQEEIETSTQAIIAKIPEDEETNKFFAELEERSNQFEQEVEFDLQTFKADVEEFVDKYGHEYRNATQQEKEQLVNYVIATNEKFDKLLQRVEDKEVVKRLIERFQKKVDQKMQQEEKVEYNEVMQMLDEEVEDIEDQQLAHVYDAQIMLEVPYALKPRQQFTFTLEDLMTEKRADIDFFEIVKLELRPGTYCEDEDDFEDMDDEDCYVPSKDEGRIVSSENTVYGVAPTRESEFIYDVQLKYTSFKDGGDSVIYDSVLIILVGDFGEVEFRAVLLYTIIGLLAVSALLIGFICVKRCKGRNVLAYEDFAQEVQFERKSVDGPPSSDLQRTASDSEERN